MRYVGHALWFLPGLGAIALIWAVSAAVNWRFGLSLGTNEPFDLVFASVNTSQVYSSASFACDVIKTCLPFALVGAVQARLYRAGGAILIALILSVLWSLSSAIGFAALNHSLTTDIRGKDKLAWEQLTEEIERTEQRRKWTPEARPLAGVQAERAGREQSYLFTQTSGCTDVTLPVSAKFCNAWRALKVEEGNARALADLDTRLARLRSELQNTPKVSSESPRDEMFAHVTGLSERTVSAGYGFYFALMIEAVASLGFWALCAAYSALTFRPKIDVSSTVSAPVEKISSVPLEIVGQEGDAEPSRILPEDDRKVHKLQLTVVPKKLTGHKDVDKITSLWLDKRLRRVDVSTHGTAANSLHEDYVAFCEALPEPVEPVNVSMLGKSVRRLAVSTKRGEDATRWGLQLRAA